MCLPVASLAEGVCFKRSLGLAAAALLASSLVCSLSAANAQPGPPIRTLVYGGDSNFAPYEFINERGEPAGLNVDLIRAVARAQGVQVIVQLKPWSQVRARLTRGGGIDVAAMYRSPQRAEQVDFAIPHEIIYHEMFIRRGQPALHSLADLAGKRILVEAEALTADALLAMGYGAQLRLLPSEPAALQALARSEGDVAIVTQSAGRPFQERKPLLGKVAPTGPPVLLAEYGFVAPKGRRDVIELLNQGLAAVKASGEYDQIYHRWVRPDYPIRLLRVVFWSLGLGGMVLTLVLVWIFLLRRQVAQQTRALREEFEARERAQAALVENEKALRQSQKMEAVGRVAGGVAHDFNNILAVIVTWAGLLREELAAEQKDTAKIDEILAAAERASRLIRQLLTFSRAVPLEIVQLNLCERVGGLSSMLQRLVGMNIRLESALPGAGVYIDADPTLIEQILLNLAANARDAMPLGGTLQLGVESIQLEAGTPRGLPAGQYALLSVADTGAGMDEETLGKIFEPFFTTKEVGHGTGLGLATVNASVTKLGGKISVQSSLGQGTRFEVVLPLSRKPAPLQPAAAALPPTQARGETILLVEDDETLRQVARIALEQLGYRVLEARDGLEGEQLALKNDFFLMVSDVVMPRCSGPLMVERLRPRIPELRVLFVSGYVGDAETLHLNAPGTAFLSKPYTIAELQEAITRMAGRVRRPGEASESSPTGARPAR